MANIKTECETPTHKSMATQIGKIILIGAIAIACINGLPSCQKTYTKESAKIEKLIAERNFDKAREIANGIPADEFDYINGKRVYYRPALITKINTAQLSMSTSDGHWDDAQDLALEIGAQDEFQQLVSANLNRILRTQNYSMIFNILSTWHIKSPYFPVVENTSYTGKGDMYEDRGNVPYNEEIQAYNRIVDGVLQQLIFDQNISLIKKCLSLYKEEAVSVKKEKEYPCKETFKLQNKARRNAMEKLKAEGITIK